MDYNPNFGNKYGCIWLEKGWHLRQVLLGNPYKGGYEIILDCFCAMQGPDALLTPKGPNERHPITRFDQELKKFWCKLCKSIAPKDVTLFAELCFVYKINEDYDGPEEMKNDN